MTPRWRERVAAHGPRLLALAQRVFLVVALAAIVGFLVLHREELAQMLTPAVLARCAACALVLALIHPLIATAFFLLQRHLGIRVDFATSLGIYMRRIPARYLPGGIWHSAARYADMKFDAGVGGAALRRLFLAEVGLVATTGLIASGAGVWATQAGSRAYGFAAAQLALGVVVALAVLFLLRRSALRSLVTAAAMYVLIWCAAAGAFVLIADALAAANTPDCGAAAIGASYLIAAVQGYLAVFAPQGWGVAETSFAVLNACGIALPTVLGAFVLFRLSAIVGDIIGYVAWALLARYFQRRTGSPTRVD